MLGLLLVKHILNLQFSLAEEKNHCLHDRINHTTPSLHQSLMAVNIIPLGHVHLPLIPWLETIHGKHFSIAIEEL